MPWKHYTTELSLIWIVNTSFLLCWNLYLPEVKGLVFSSGQNTHSWTIAMDYLYVLCCWSLVISVRNLSESVSIWCHYTGKTDLKLDSLSFLTLTLTFSSIVQFRVGHGGSPWTGGQWFMSYTLQNKVLVPFYRCLWKFAMSKVSMIFMGWLSWRGQPWIYDNHCFNKKVLVFIFILGIFSPN